MMPYIFHIYIYFIFVMGRIGDVINIAGYHLSAGEMEETLAAHDTAVECTVTGVYDSLKGQVPVCLDLLKDGSRISDADLQSELVAMVLNETGAVACLKQVLVVPRLPKTCSSKIFCKLPRKIAEVQTFLISSLSMTRQVSMKIRRSC